MNQQTLNRLCSADEMLPGRLPERALYTVWQAQDLQANKNIFISFLTQLKETYGAERRKQIERLNRQSWKLWMKKHPDWKTKHTIKNFIETYGPADKKISYEQ